ncbi:Glycosyl hydrolases family 16 [Capnocytophaga haemolytica]|uniref:Beta-glucanase n=1 Tax=Capnocytophaga haemolytica TaxID=45243 RepID=A0AAX2GVI5_9FLAO|nr:glycoside hydrolase family 16 protein [Capnocytophaga haemolytica]AMD85213.1 hypothetical protein AXF12_06630 [Capnocytophaga haemolytica]SFN64425.1 Glycosyl hydrolases family 16 [Capnocytophaga haemolytica]SNV04122.1 Beta-glucanase precursor [Capnocytophaga haemolytica]
MKKIIYFMAVMSAMMVSSCGKDDSGSGEWVLDFEDNFDGTQLNKDNWTIYDNAGSTNPDHKRRVEAIEVKDGLLNCIVDKHPTDSSHFMAGGIGCRKNYLYGKFEFRIRMDHDPLYATSGVALTWPESEVWPKDGENDIFETEYETHRWDTYIHYVNDQGEHKTHHHNYDMDKTQWRVVAMEWTPDYIKTYVDGKLMWTLEDRKTIPKVTHHICFQVEKHIDKGLEKPVRLQVDWVKIYKRK